MYSVPGGTCKGRISILCSAPLALALLGLATGGGWADEIYWNQPAGGSFNQSGNWDPQQVPGADDVARFDLGQDPAYQVAFDGNGHHQLPVHPSH